MITLAIIKDMVESSSLVPDISVANRKREVADARFVFFTLARKYTNNSLSAIGLFLKSDWKPKGFDHSSVLHGIKQCDNLLGNTSFTGNKVYLECNKKLSELEKTPSKMQNFNDTRDLEQYYRIKHIRIVEAQHKIINKLNANIERLSNNSILQKLSKLPLNEYQECEKRINLFLKVQEKLKENKKQQIKLFILYFG